MSRLTARDVSKVISMYLGVEAAPHAARLAREGLLPRRDARADEWDAALLLLAVAAAPEPAKAIEAVDGLLLARLLSAQRALTSTLSPGCVWQPLSDEDCWRLPGNAVEAVVEALEDSDRVSLTSVMVRQGGGATTIHAFVRQPPMAELRICYARPEPSHRAGLQRSAVFYGEVVNALAGVLRPERSRAVMHPVSFALH